METREGLGHEYQTRMRDPCIPSHSEELGIKIRQMKPCRQRRVVCLSGPIFPPRLQKRVIYFCIHRPTDVIMRILYINWCRRSGRDIYRERLMPGPSIPQLIGTGRGGQRQNETECVYRNGCVYSFVEIGFFSG